jgi:hypothetical protein
LHAGSRLSNNSSHGLRRAHNPTPVCRSPRPDGRIRSGFPLTLRSVDRNSRAASPTLRSSVASHS